MLSYAGNTHPIVVLRDQAAFDEFTFDPSAMRTLMDAQGWAGTVTILHPLDDNTFEARNLFPVGNIVEDPATGSAAASTGGYLRKLEPAATPRRITIHQADTSGDPAFSRSRSRSTAVSRSPAPPCRQTTRGNHQR